MQISSLKMEAWVSLTQSLSIISLFPSLALKHLLQHRLRPTGSLRLCLRVASNVINVAKFSSSMSVPRQFISANLISFSYFDTNWQTFCFFLLYDSCHCFLQFGFQKWIPIMKDALLVRCIHCYQGCYFKMFPWAPRWCHKLNLTGQRKLSCNL